MGDSIGAGIVYYLSKDELETCEELKNDAETGGMIETPQAPQANQSNGDTSSSTTLQALVHISHFAGSFPDFQRISL